MESNKKSKKFPVSVSDTELRYKVKAAAARANKSMGDWLADAIRLALKKEDK